MCFCVWPRCVFFWKGNILLPLIQVFLILIFIIIKWLRWSLLAWLDPEQRFSSSKNPHFLLANLGIKGHDVICHNQGVGDRWHHEKYCILHNIEGLGALGNIVSFKGIIKRNTGSCQKHYLKEYCRSFCILREQCWRDLIQTQLFQLSGENRDWFTIINSCIILIIIFTFNVIVNKLTADQNWSLFFPPTSSWS